MGLLGSQYYVENPTVELGNALAMINMDMVGRMNDNRLMIFGVATTDGWESILTEANSDSLDLDLVPDGTGASDHTSFYYKDIPVLHYFTDTHADYHRPSDDTEWINEEGQELLLKHLVRVVQKLDEMDKEEMVFTEAPGEQQRNMTMSGPTLGVLPDYGYDGEGFRITGVSEGRAADNAGIEGGDVIINIAGMEIADIYAYMEALNELEAGQQTTVTVMRDGEELTFELQL
jgi:C-terminal processing protease CtpA/Prc